MKKLVILFLAAAVFNSCKKEDTPVVEKIYTVEYKLTGTPLANTSLTGTISYISKTSATTSGSLSNNQWTVTEGSWKLKAGDKIGFTAAIANLASYQATLNVDGGLRIFQAGSQTIPATTNINVAYTVE